MAAEDYNVADRPDAGRTAGEKIGDTAYDNPDVDARERADAAGVSHPAYIDYATALNAFQSRDDIETLADRRKREVGTDFNAGSFMRRRAYTDTGEAAAAPRPGTVYGDAPKSA